MSDLQVSSVAKDRKVADLQVSSDAKDPEVADLQVSSVAEDPEVVDLQVSSVAKDPEVEEVQVSSVAKDPEVEEVQASSVVVQVSIAGQDVDLQTAHAASRAYNHNALVDVRDHGLPVSPFAWASPFTEQLRMSYQLSCKPISSVTAALVLLECQHLTVNNSTVSARQAQGEGEHSGHPSRRGHQDQPVLDCHGLRPCLGELPSHPALPGRAVCGDQDDCGGLPPQPAAADHAPRDSGVQDCEAGIADANPCWHLICIPCII